MTPQRLCAQTTDKELSIAQILEGVVNGSLDAGVAAFTITSEGDKFSDLIFIGRNQSMELIDGIKGATMKLTKHISLTVLLLLTIAVVNANAVGIVVGTDGKARSTKLNLPFAFYNETFGVAAGYVNGVGGWPQPQSTLLSTTIAGSTGSAMSFLIAKDLQMPFTLLGCSVRWQH